MRSSLESIIILGKVGIAVLIEVLTIKHSRVQNCLDIIIWNSVWSFDLFVTRCVQILKWH